MEEIKSPPFSVTVRRNPHRKARPTTTATKCLPNPTLPSALTPLEVSTFPIDDILAMDVPKKNPNLNSDASLEYLRVFLRIRPILQSKGQNPKPRAKNAWPQNPIKKITSREKTVIKNKFGDVCITVNDSHSVTLSPPLALQESKRIKSEVYEGFSHVFATDSSQEQVFKEMVQPLVTDFLKGKSGMLAALGPSGSGKTHTVFGSPRDPGIVPRTLQQIFELDLDDCSDCRRLFSISVFEIHSERGKGEKIHDLNSGGAEPSMQQSTIKGLQEVIVSDVKEAESLIANAMLRRLTASTYSNSQSSRSQCIINIRGAASSSDGEKDSQPNNAVFTIIDLAGAERERKTGNQGSRLLESNFINNTSMVLSLCLRSLLEHQKNPKKPLQKYFQNSLLTRYLRDYLEGKRRMTLILTVKSEEEDYLDTTYLLRQASPFMSIRCNNAEEQSSVHCNKRQYQAKSRKEKPKRMKLSGSNVCEIAEKNILEEEHRNIPEEELCAPMEGDSKGKTFTFNSKIPNPEVNDAELIKMERSYHILQKIAKALWVVLKQHGKKLKVAEDEVQCLAENLKIEKTRNVELENRLEDLKSNCTCSQQKSTVVAVSEEETYKHGVELVVLDTLCLDKSNVDPSFFSFTLPECNDAPLTPKINYSTQIQDHATSSQTNLELHPPNVSESEADTDSLKGSSNAEPSLIILSHVKELKLDLQAIDGSCLPDKTSHHIYRVKEEAFYIDSNVLEHVDTEQVFDTPVSNSDVAVGRGLTHHLEISRIKCQIDEINSGGCHNPKIVHNFGGFETNSFAGETEHSASSRLSIKLESLVDEKEQELLNLPKTKKCIVSYRDAVDTNDHSAIRAEKPKGLLNLPETEKCVVPSGRVVGTVDSSELSVDIPAKSLKSSISGKDVAPKNDRKAANEPYIDQENNDLTEKEQELLNLPKTKKCVASSGDAVDTNDHSAIRAEKPKGLLNLPETEKCVVPSGRVVGTVDSCELSVDILAKSLKSSISGKDVAPKNGLKAANEPNIDQENNDLTKHVKPKRRLLPASSLLLKDYNTLDFEDKSEKPKGNRGGNKYLSYERYRSQGNTALLRLLQSNHRV